MQKNVTIFMTPQRLRRFLCAKRAAGDVKKAGGVLPRYLQRGNGVCRGHCDDTRFCHAIAKIQMAEWYRFGISQRRTKILFADGNTKCGGKRA